MILIRQSSESVKKTITDYIKKLEIDPSRVYFFNTNLIAPKDLMNLISLVDLALDTVIMNGRFVNADCFWGNVPILTF